MVLDQENILKFIQSKADRPMRIKEMAQALSIEKSDYAAFRRMVRKLVESGELVRLKRGRIGLADQLNIMVGKISINRSGTGFLEREAEVDILIPTTELMTAFDGDKVMVRLTGQVGGRQAGKVIKVLERAARNIVGLFYRRRGFCYVEPDNPRIHRTIYVPPDDTMKARDGEKVVVALTQWDDPNLNPLGRVTDRIGFPNQPGVDMRAVLKNYDLPEQFPQEILAEAERAAAVDTNQEETSRLDLTNQCVYTIDPKDAKDHDDAVSVERKQGGYRLGVHIADVSFFVKEGTALDAEGFQRGNSVYFPGMVIPMLPEVLSNNICSLKPNRRRLAHSVFIDFDRKGNVLRWKIADTVIRSRAKLSYEEVQEFFDTEKASSNRISRVADNLLAARELARLLARRRAADGSLDFDLPEAKIILNEKGEVLELGSRVRLESHRLVEEFMLAANRAVALEVFRKAQPFVYRVHGRPDMEKLEAFSDMMSRLGYRFPVSKTVKPAQFARFLERVKESPEADFINELMLRSMQKAVYQRDNIGHFGLAFTHYTHFTSPIRRYPDLLVHRLLRKLKKGHYPTAFARRVRSVIDSAAKHCSETERKAEQAEREAVRVKQAAFMAHHLGEEYDGVISGTTPYGFFVRLANMGVEGMVRVSTIDDDYYNYEENQFRIVGRRTGRTFRLGDPIRVGVVKVDTVHNEIDLYPVLPPAKKTRKPARKRSRR